MQELLLLVLMFGLVACADPEDPPPVATKSAVLTGSGGPRTGSQADGGGCDCARCNQPAPTPKAAAGPVTPPPAAQLLSAADLQWSDFAEFDEAASAARLYEDKQSKASVLYLKLPKKFAVTGKRHPASLFSTVIKGAITVAVGDDKPTALKVGSFLLIPANTPYSLTAKKGATLFVSSMPPPYHSAAGSSAKLGDSADVFHRTITK